MRSSAIRLGANFTTITKNPKRKLLMQVQRWKYPLWFYLIHILPFNLVTKAWWNIKLFGNISFFFNMLFIDVKVFDASISLFLNNICYCKLWYDSHYTLYKTMLLFFCWHIVDYITTKTIKVKCKKHTA